MQHKDNDAEQAVDRLPDAVKLSWGIVRKPRRGPKGELSIPRIVEAAVAIADKDGLAAMSMSKVAQSLGFTTMSLYRYIKSKDDLQLLMQDYVCAVPIPSEEEGKAMGWREEMRAFVQACVAVFREHPWFGELPVRSIPLMPNTLHIMNWMFRIMKDFPITPFEKMSFMLLLNSYARACGLVERDVGMLLQAGHSMDTFSGLDHSAALKRLITPERFPDLYPILMSGAYTGEADSPIEDELDFGLDRVLDGIEQYLERKSG